MHVRICIHKNIKVEKIESCIFSIQILIQRSSSFCKSTITLETHLNDVARNETNFQTLGIDCLMN